MMYGSNHPERIKLNNKIKEWNANRLDLFQISEPNDYLEFYGVMRFFYQGDDFKYQTKCLRVNSTATTLDVVDALIVKFNPILKSSQASKNDKYTLYESHNLQDRRMKNSEHPLIVQLNWASDDKDGKFLLRNESRRRRSTDMTNQSNLSNYGMSRSTSTLANGFDSQTLRTQSSAIYSSSSNFFSRRFSNSKKSKRKIKSALEDAEEAKRLAEEMSGKPPESSFTRTISNPDDVMKRRRQKKLESRLEQFSGVKGDGETGGTLKIYGDSINPDIPYKTLLLSVNDTADKVLLETLDKYGIPPEEYRFYVLVQQNLPPREIRSRGHIEEIILHSDDCPLGILVHCPPKQGSAMFAVRRIQKSDKFPTSARMPPFAFSKKHDPTTEDSPYLGPRSSHSNVSSLPRSPDEYSETIVEYPRLKKVFVDADGCLYDEEDGLFSLSSLINKAPKDAPPTDGSKLIKIGSQSSDVGSYPNIWLPLEDYCDIRSVHCHIKVKLDPQSNRMKFYLTPALDASSRTPRPCAVFINQRHIDSSSWISNGDIIQLGDSVMFQFEECEDEPETESLHSRSVEDGGQETFENSTESMNISQFTSELPITIKYKYKKSVKLLGNVMKFSKDYAERGSKELYNNGNIESLSETFRLSPAYMLYMVMRAGLGKEQQVVQLIDLISSHIDQVIQEDRNNVEKEIFWLSNTSELLHLLQCDNDLRIFSEAGQDVLASAIEHSFSIVQQQFSKDLMILLPALLSEDDLDIDDNTQEDNIPCLDRAVVLTEQGSIDYPIQHLLQTLSLAFTLFHNCQVNVALTVQMFSQLFHLLNTWLFNTILGETTSSPGDDSGYMVPVCQEWGNRLTRRLNRIRYWSEINGLEMAANCHLQKMYEVAELMKADKSDLEIFGEKCIEMMSLNGAQLQHLLVNCQDYELPDPWIEVVVNTAIQLHERDFNDPGRVTSAPQDKSTLVLYEDMELRLPLLLPADGYCCDRGIVTCPTDLLEMLNFVKDNMKYRINSPETETDPDSRWKAYLGTCENTPTVSRSNTIDHSPTSPQKTNGPGLPRNWVPTEELSLSATLSSPSKDKVQIRPKPSATPVRPTSSISSTSGRPNGLEDSLSYSIIRDGANELFELKLRKIDNSLGLSIIAARPTSKDMFRIYVKDVINGGAGSKSGQIFSGDQLVSIDGHLLDDMNQDEAVVFMKKTNSEVTLVIDRGAAQRHGVMDVIMKARSSKNNPGTQKSGQRPSNGQQPPIKKPLSSLNSPPKFSASKDEHARVTLPPPPTAKAPPKPVQATHSNNIKMAPRKTSDLAVPEPDYNSLPVRNHKSHQLTDPDYPAYATVKKGEPLKVKFDPKSSSLAGKSSISNSQPNLNNIIPAPKRQPILSSSGSSSSCSTSSSDDDDDDEDSVTSIPKQFVKHDEKRNSSSVYEKLPQQNQQKQAMPNIPTKAVSDLNIHSKKPTSARSAVASSESELRSEEPEKPFLSRPTLAHNSDPIISLSSQDCSETLSLNKPVKRNESSSSESESETLSSQTESSTPSDSSPQPQRKLNSEPVSVAAKVDPASLQQPSRPSTANDTLSDRRAPSSIPNLGGFRKPLIVASAKADEPLSMLLKQEPLNISKDPSDHVKPVETITPNHQNVEPKAALRKVPPEDEIKMRRKAIADSIRQQAEEKEQRLKALDQIEPAVSPAENKDRNSVKYGRPQFNPSNQAQRPQSLFKPEPNPNQSSHDSDFNFPSPPSSVMPVPGIIIPANQVTTLKPVTALVNGGSKSSRTDNPQDGVEELSFREKMKLFAAKIGDENIIERKKFGSKQQRINSGDYY